MLELYLNFLHLLLLPSRLVLKSPDFVAKMFYNHDGKQDGETWPLPPLAVLLPEGERKCSESTRTSAQNLRGDVPSGIMVNFTGGQHETGNTGPYGPAYDGRDLTVADGDSGTSAWIYLFQETMRHFAQEDIQSSEPGRGKWSNMKDEGDNVQRFNSEAELQKCDKLGRMLYLATGKDTIQESVGACALHGKLETVLDSISESPVLLIPKASKDQKGESLQSDRIWIGMSKDQKEDSWIFWNPVEKKKPRAMSKSQVEALAMDIVYFEDHSSL